MKTNKVYWLSGLSGAGKSTVAEYVARKIDCVILDGDILREGVCKGLGFSIEDREENLRRVAHVAKILRDAGKTVVVATISPTVESRNNARNIIGEDFVGVYVDTPLQTCSDRDTKGMYAKAYAGEIPDFTGVSSVFEPFLDADLIVHCDGRTVKDSAKTILDHYFLEAKSRADKKTSVFIGRWQPLHKGHCGIIRKALEEGDNVTIVIRDQPVSDKNPFTVKEREVMIAEEFGDSVDVVAIPDGDVGFDVCHGRDVGWGVRRIHLDDDLEKVSGTAIRKQMGI